MIIKKKLVQKSWQMAVLDTKEPKDQSIKWQLLFWVPKVVMDGLIGTVNLNGNTVVPIDHLRQRLIQKII